MAKNKMIAIPETDFIAIKAILDRLHTNIGPWAGEVLKREAERLARAVDGMNEKNADQGSVEP